MKDCVGDVVCDVVNDGVSGGEGCGKVESIEQMDKWTNKQMDIGGCVVVMCGGVMLCCDIVCWNDCHLEAHCVDDGICVCVWCCIVILCVMFCVILCVILCGGMMLFGAFDFRLTDGRTDICTSRVAFATENSLCMLAEFVTWHLYKWWIVNECECSSVVVKLCVLRFVSDYQ